MAALAALTWHLAGRAGTPEVPDAGELIGWLPDCPPADLETANQRLRLVIECDGWIESVTKDAVYAGASIPEVQEAWLSFVDRGEKPPHPVAPLISAWHARPKPDAPRRTDPLLPKIVFGGPAPERERGMLLGGLVPEDAPEANAELPLFPDAKRRHLPQVSLLELADATGAQAVSKGRGANLEFRLTVESVLSTPKEDREGSAIRPVRIAPSVDDLIYAMHGPKTRDGKQAAWLRIREALLGISQRWIPVGPEGRGRWWLVRLGHEPGDRPRGTDLVLIDVSLPPGSGAGPEMPRSELQAAGRRSGGEYRSQIGFPTLAWNTGRTRFPAKGGETWLWAGDRKRYPVLTPEDRRLIVWGRTPKEASGRSRAAADRVIREAKGIAVVSEDARDPLTGERGWIVVPTKAANAIAERDRRLSGAGENRGEDED